ncbi:MAG: CbiX/SirB N-terminal domain-containing protein [bacterium]
MSRARLVLIAHGSTRSTWRAPLEALRDRLAARLGADGVRLAFMELCPPDLGTVLAEAAADGVDAVRVLPLFMSAGGHVTHDIAPAVEALRSKHPAIALELLPALGEHPRVLDALCEIAIESGVGHEKPG